MNRKPWRRSSTISSRTASTRHCRGFWPSVRHTEQNEQCLGQPRTGLNRAPHVASVWQQLPARCDEAVGIDASGLIEGLQGTLGRVVQDQGPYHVAIAFDDGMRAAETLRL